MTKSQQGVAFGNFLFK